MLTREFKSIMETRPSMHREDLIELIAGIENPATIETDLLGYAAKLSSERAAWRGSLLAFADKATVQKAISIRRGKNRVGSSVLSTKLNSALESSLNESGTWEFYFRKLASWIGNGMLDTTPFAVLNAKGNKKLPFYAFSTLPLIDCPGKGDCANWCYSLKAWRYPAAFCRQLQNSLLVRNRLHVLENSIQEVKENTTVRLYVDGDFPSIDILKFWMDTCKTRPDVSFYGYSKSWSEFVSLDSTGYAWPENYVLNLSSGSRWINTGIANAVKALPVVRGGFNAVPVARHHITSKAYQDKANDGSVAYRKEVRDRLSELFGKRVFACPGNCGNCMAGGKHACGSKDMTDVEIGIGIHS